MRFPMRSRCTPYHRPPTASRIAGAGVVSDGPGHHTAPADARALTATAVPVQAPNFVPRAPRPRPTVAPLHEESSAAVPESRLRGHVDKLQIDGDYRYEPGDDWPHHFRLSIPEADLADIERILLPTLRRERSRYFDASSFDRHPSRLSAMSLAYRLGNICRLVPFRICRISSDRIIKLDSTPNHKKDRDMPLNCLTKKIIGLMQRNNRF